LFPMFSHFLSYFPVSSICFTDFCNTQPNRNRMELNPQKREKTSSLEIQTCRVKPCYINHFKPLEMSLGNSWRSLPAATWRSATRAKSFCWRRPFRGNLGVNLPGWATAMHTGCDFRGEAPEA
jgi:hypothetical protein